MTNNPAFMIYGVNGYTGRHCAEEALKRGLQPIVAGRGQDRVSRVASELNVSFRVFDLTDTNASIEGLQGIGAVLNCAGPFSATARPLLDACTATGVHYLDVTGEIGVFEYVHQRDNHWKQAGIVALPGVGFDVVPTDCMAAMLKEALPDATRLRLAFKSKRGKLSPGTAKTMLEGFAKGCTIRRDGRLEQTHAGSITDMIPYPGGPSLSVVIPWGDVSTAFYSTGIPNIEVYTSVPEAQLKKMRSMRRFTPLLHWTWVQNFMKRRIERHVTGPDEAERNRDTSELFGEVTNDAGDCLSMTMVTPNGYSLTFDSAITAAQQVLAGAVEPGAKTPSLAFGNSFVLGLKGVRIIDGPEKKHD